MKKVDSSTKIKLRRTVYDLKGNEINSSDSIVDSPYKYSEFDDSPGFYADSRAGRFRYNRYHSVYSEVSEASTSITASGKRVVNCIMPSRYYTYLHYDATPSKFAELRGNAINSAIARMQDVDVNTWTTLGELPTSVKYIADALRRILATLKHLFIKRRKHHKVSLSALWLEARYAIRPMIMDIINWINVLNGKTQAPEGAEIWPLSSGRISVPYTEEIYGGGLRYGGYASISVQGTATASVGLRYKQPKVTGAYSVGATPEFVLPAAWDLVPLSWVIDWFYDLSTYLKGLSVGLSGNYEYIGGWVTSVRSGVTICTPKPTSADHVCNGRVIQVVRLKDREPLAFMPSVTLPEITLDLNRTQVVDLLALVIETLTGRSPNRRVLHG